MPSIFAPAKHLLKKQLQYIAAHFGRHTRRPAQPELLLLMYHRILPLDDPRAQLEEPGMIVSPETFESHMTQLKELFEPIHLSQWLDKKNNGENLPMRSCAVTFDDGWADNYEFAFPILQKLNIPATIFLVSDMIGSKQQFWPERLAQLLTVIAQQQPGQWSHPALEWIKQTPCSYSFASVAPTQEQMSEIIATVKDYSDEDIHQRLDLIEDKLQLTMQQDNPSLLDWQQVNTMCDTGLIEAGSHTRHHIRLTGEKSEALLQDEIINSKTLIEEKTGKAVKTFCYPNGDTSANARSIVEQHYAGAVTTEHGWNTADSNRYLLQRIGVHEDISKDKTSFLARLSGWL